MLAIVPRSAQPRAAATVGEAALAIHKSPAQLRLDALQQEHERLLRDITKKRAMRDVVEADARDAASAIAARVMPLREAFGATLRELKAIFVGLLGEDSHLNKRDKARVRRLYARLLPDLAGERDDEEEPRSAPFDREGPSWDEVPDDGSEAGYSAHKPAEKNTGVLRALFRKLAIALHPDKVQDPSEREQLTSVMKEVTRAYETGDVARLVEIERAWLAHGAAPEQENDVARRITELLSANKELRRQLRALTAELKEIKHSVPGLASPRRRGARSSAVRTELDEMVEQMERELAELRGLRDFARRFADGEVSVTEFLLGPELGHDDDDPLDQMLAEVLAAMAEDPPPRRGSRRRQRR
jgi:DnaJ-domain-containing protein 1